LTALDVLDNYKDQWIVEHRHRDLKQTLRVRPVFLHNDDRIHALIAVIGIALLIYGFIEADLRAALGPDSPLAGLLPEHRDAMPTARAVLAAYADLHATYTSSGGLVLDRLTTVQRRILAYLEIPLPWPETHNATTTFNNSTLDPQPSGKRETVKLTV
jgi:transposase